MSASNLAVRIEHAALDLSVESPRPALQVITNTAPLLARSNRPRTSLEFRKILIRDHGFRSFRVY